MKLRLPRHWSEWALAFALVLLAAKSVAFATHEWHMLQRNGGLWYAVKSLFGY